MTKEYSIRGRRISCRIDDGGAPDGAASILFIHGSGGDRTVWGSQFDALAGRFRLAAVDLPGHGGSDGAGECSVDAYVEWIGALLDVCGLGRPVLAGHSLGAAIALRFAIRYGDRISGILPAGGGATMPVNPLLFDGLKTDPEGVLSLMIRFSVAKSNRERLAEPLRRSLASVRPEILLGDLSACAAFDIREEAARIRIPVMVVCGNQDKMTPPALSQDLRERIPGAGLALIDGAGHFAMLENPEALNGVIADFAAGLPPV